MAIKTREPSDEFKQQLPPQLPVIKKKRSWREVEADQSTDDETSFNENAIEQEKPLPIIATPTVPQQKGASKALEKLATINERKSVPSHTRNESIFQDSNQSIAIDMKILIKLAQTSLAGRENQIIMLMLALSNGNFLEEIPLSYSQITKATGISPQHLSLVIKNLTDKNVIIKTSNALNHGNSYQLNKAFFSENVDA